MIGQGLVRQGKKILRSLGEFASSLQTNSADVVTLWSDNKALIIRVLLCGFYPQQCVVFVLLCAFTVLSRVYVSDHWLFPVFDLILR